MMNRRQLCYLMVVLSITFADVLWSAEAIRPVPASQVTPAAKSVTKFDVADFEYKSEGRRDPFEAVMMNKMAKSRVGAVASKNKKEQEDQVSYELESLKLVGVLKSDTGMMAMMEDAQGKGIFFRKGDPLNNKIGMWVADIASNNVVFAYKLKGEIKKVVVDLPKK